MVKFREYITEEKFTLDSEIEAISRDCKPFLKSLKGSTHLLWRGSNKQSKPFEKLKPRSDRRPVDMDPLIHEFLDDEFNRKFGWKARSEGLFCCGGEAATYGYGKATIVFPIGKFKYVWSPSIEDLYSTLSSVNIMVARRDELSTKDKNEIIKYVKTYTDKDIKKYLSKGTWFEIAIKCDSYWSLRSDDYGTPNAGAVRIDVFEGDKWITV